MLSIWFGIDRCDFFVIFICGYKLGVEIIVKYFYLKVGSVWWSEFYVLNLFSR